MIAYRIAKGRYIRKLDGMGSYLYGGRWTREGTHAIYTAEHRSLAYLEYLVHQISQKIWPTDLSIAILDIPSDGIVNISKADLPEDWDSTYLQDITRQVGTDLFAKGHLAFRIPSVIVAGEYNIVLNPNHADFDAQVQIKSVESLRLDQRFQSG